MTNDTNMSAALPPELRDYDAELVHAARARSRRRAWIARRARSAVALVSAFLVLSGLAVAAGVVDSPFERAPRAAVYDVYATDAHGATTRLRCVEGTKDTNCAAAGDRWPMHALAFALQRRAVDHARVTLNRVCRRGAGCRTLPAPREPGPGELTSARVVGLRPPAKGERVAVATAGTLNGLAGERLRVVGGPYAGRVVSCAGGDAADPLCALRRSATTPEGLVDVARLMRLAGAERLIADSGRRCTLTGDGRCRGIDPAQARRLGSDPGALARGEMVVYERQVTALGFSTPPPRPPAKGERRPHAR